MADQPDAYRVLQVDPEADPEVVQAAYRRLAQKYHPDTTNVPDAAARMVAINAAWETLRDPKRRAAFDAERRLRGSGPGGSGPGGSGPEGGMGRVERPGGSPHQGATRPAARPTPPEEVSRNWSSGRSTLGGGYDPATMGRADGDGAAGPAPGSPSGPVLNFGRYAGWSLGEVARTDIEYLEWLDRTPIGRPYRDDIDALLRRAGRRRSTEAEATERRGLFRRR